MSWTSNARGEKQNIVVASSASLVESVQAEPVTDADDDAMRGRIACASVGNVYLTYHKWQTIGQDRK